MKKLVILAALVGLFGLAGCSRDADVASRNLSKAADMNAITKAFTKAWQTKNSKSANEALEKVYGADIQPEAQQAQSQ